MLKVANIYAGYVERVDVLKGSSLEAQRGTVYVLLGPNDSSKTTTFRVVAGALPPRRGHMIVDYLGLWREPLKVKELIGYVPKGGTYPELTGRKNLLVTCKVFNL